MGQYSNLLIRASYRFSRGAFLVLFGIAAGTAQVQPSNSKVVPSSNPSPIKSTEISSAANSPDFSKEALVIDQFHTRIHMDADGTGTRATTARIHVLADAGVKAMAVIRFTYSASYQQVDIAYVRVRKPDGSIVETPSYNVQDMPADVSREAPMYSDIREKHVAVRGLGVGDTLEYEETLRILKPELPGQFWFEYTFEKNAIVLEEEFDLDIPSDKTVTVASSGPQPVITVESGRKLFHWNSSNLKHPDPNEAPISNRHWKPSVQITTFTSWEQVGAWYQALQRDSLVVTPAIQAHADAVTRGLTDTGEKIRALANDVSLHVHYVGLDFGIGRYQPHTADEVLANEYGDCKDKHTLLAALLKAVGIDAWPVLISGSRDLDPTVPSPAQFNHVITVVPNGESLTWIDSTAEIAPVGTLMPSLRDKQALAIPNTKAALIERTPAKSPTPGAIRLEVQAQLTDYGLLKGHFTQKTTGDSEMLLRLAFRRTPQSQWKELVQDLARAQGYAGETSNAQISDVEQIDQPLTVSFDYTREKYYQWDSSHTTHWIDAPLPPLGLELAPRANEKKPADNPQLGSTATVVYHADLRLPSGWTVTPPRDVDINEDWLEYRAAYSFKNGVYTVERAMFVKKPEVPLEQWERYLSFRRKAYDDWNREVLIQPGRGTASLSDFGPSSTEDSLTSVKVDSLPVYAKPTKESDIVFSLTRGKAVRLGLSVVTDEGMFCSISDADTSAKLGYVHCEGLDRQPSSGAPANGTTVGNQTSLGVNTSCESLEYAVATGEISEVRMILETQSSIVNCHGQRGFTPLHTAADNNQTEIAELLLSHGAEINGRTSAGETPLHWAAFDNRINVATFLISKGAAINPRDKDGNTPLHWAAAKGHVEMTELLIGHGADLNAKTYTGCTPLRGAFDYHQLATARVLQRHGATQ